MTNDTLILVGSLIVGFVVVAGLLLNAARGVRGSLANAKIGEVYNFDYEQPYRGGHKRILAKVIEPVTTVDDSWIKIMNKRSNYRRNDPVFQRTKHMVVCEMPNGDIRQFYAERASNVRRSVLGGQLFKVAAML